MVLGSIAELTGEEDLLNGAGYPAPLQIGSLVSELVLGLGPQVPALHAHIGHLDDLGHGQRIPQDMIMIAFAPPKVVMVSPSSQAFFTIGLA